MSRVDGLGRCVSCGGTFPYYLIHNGFNESSYAYCDSCGSTAIFDDHSAPPLPSPLNFAVIPSRLENRILGCHCGGRFTADAKPRCPHCNTALSATDAAEWIEANAAGTKKGWRWQRNWSGLYCIVIDDKVVHNAWRS